MKAHGKKRRAGRPRKPGGRYPSGNIKPSETEREAKSVVIDARMRHHGLTPEQSKSDLAGHVLGRIYLDNHISKAMFDAGLSYGDDVRRYFAHYLGGAPTVSAQNLMKVRGYDGDVSRQEQERGRKAKETHTELECVLVRCGPGVRQTVYNVCVDDIDGMRLMPPAQMDMLQRGLRALIWHYGINEARSA